MNKTKKSEDLTKEKKAMYYSAIQKKWGLGTVKKWGGKQINATKKSLRVNGKKKWAWKWDFALMNKTKKSEDLTKEKKSDVLQFHSKKSADLAPSKNEGGNK